MGKSGCRAGAIRALGYIWCVLATRCRSSPADRPFVTRHGSDKKKRLRPNLAAGSSAGTFRPCPPNTLNLFEKSPERQVISDFGSIPGLDLARVSLPLSQTVNLHRGLSHRHRGTLRWRPRHTSVSDRFG